MCLSTLVYIDNGESLDSVARVYTTQRVDPLWKHPSVNLYYTCSQLLSHYPLLAFITYLCVELEHCYEVRDFKVLPNKDDAKKNIDVHSNLNRHKRD